MTLFRIVLDTNILVSSMFNGNGPSGRIVYSWLINKEIDVITSEPLLAEASDVLSRADLHRRLDRRSEFADRLVQALPRLGVIVAALEAVSIVRDPSDNKVLEAAIAGRADYIVSGDPDLLVLGDVQGIPVVTPAAFIQVLDEARKGPGAPPNA